MQAYFADCVVRVFVFGQGASYHQLCQCLNRFRFWLAMTRDFALTQHGRAVAQRLNFIEFVRDVQNATAFGGEFSQGFKQFFDCLWREHRGRLVHN